jgi:hypothetical protein
VTTDNTSANSSVTSPVPVNSGTHTISTTTTASRHRLPSPCQPQPQGRKAPGPPNQKATTNETTSRLPRTASMRVATTPTAPASRSPTAALLPGPPHSCGRPNRQVKANLRKPEVGRNGGAPHRRPQLAHATTSSRPPPPPDLHLILSHHHLHHKVRVAPRPAPPSPAARLVSSRPSSKSSHAIASPHPCPCDAASHCHRPPPRSPGAPISCRVARARRRWEDGGVRVAAQRVRGQAPLAAVRRSQRPLGRRGRDAAEAQPPRREGAEDGAVARRVDGDHSGGRGARLAVRRRRSPDVQQPRVPRWVGRWVNGWAAFSSPPVRLAPVLLVSGSGF